MDSYDAVIRQMAFDKRSKPSDRTKTAEEAAQDLETAERSYQEAKRKRMLAMEPENSEEQEIADVSSDSEEDEAERSRRVVMRETEELLAVLTNPRSPLTLINSSFTKLVAVAKTNSVIPVARVLREKLSMILSSSFNKADDASRPPVMPDHSSLILFHLIGVIFSTSDRHHVVATPAFLLMASFLDTGRLLKKEHLLSALFLIQTVFSYTRDSKRLCPEALALLYPLAKIVFLPPTHEESFQTNQYPKTRFMSKSMHEFLVKPMADDSSRKVEGRMIEFADLANPQALGRNDVRCFIFNLIKEAISQYSAFMAAPEILNPFIELLLQARQVAGIQSEDVEMQLFSTTGRAPLQMIRQRVRAIPSLEPDIEGLSGKQDNGIGKVSREERQNRMLQRAYKREFKGAKRELARDSAFLAQSKLTARLDADRKYGERIRQIMGTISNDGAGIEGKRAKRR
jgi:nucleolar protein 14